MATANVRQRPRRPRRLEDRDGERAGATSGANFDPQSRPGTERRGGARGGSTASVAAFAVAAAALILSVSLWASSSNAVPGRLDGGGGAAVLRRRERTVTVFIGIKTGESGVHGVRLPQIRRTWLGDALAARPAVDIRFFSEADSSPSSSAAANATTAAAEGGRARKGIVDEDDLRSLHVPTSCSPRDLLCKDSAVFSYFLEHFASADSPDTASYVCSFDDDNYVLIHNLLRVLESYERDPPHFGRNIFVGRAHTIGFPTLPNVTVRYLTGGAGYCLSRDVVERGRRYLTDLLGTWRNAGVMGFADDCAVGYAVVEKLGVEPIDDDRFHSHMERALRRDLPRENISKQVSFGYDNKKRRGQNPLHAFPDVPILFSSREDPLLFRSLRCFLKREETGRDPPECSPKMP